MLTSPYFFKSVTMKFFNHPFKAILFLILISSINGYSADSLSLKSSPSKFYTRLQAGYGFIPNNSYTFERTYLNGNIQQEDQKNFSYGKGFNLEFAPGIWLNKTIGLEFSVSYVIGGNNNVTNVYEVDTVFVPYTVVQKGAYKTNMLRLGPGIIVQGDDIGKGVYPYGKLNMLFGLGSGKWSYEENVSFIGGGTARGTFDWEVKGARSFGFASTLGIKVRSEDQKTDFFIEFSYVGMGGTFDKASRTKYIINGQDQLNTLNTSQREIIYVDKMDYTEPQGTKEPTKVLRTKNNFSSVGFNLGFYINIK